MDILLAHSNLIQNDAKQARKMRPYPPLETLYAASALRAAGYTVGLYDPTFADSVDGLERLLEEQRPRVFALVEDSYNFIAKMCLEVMRATALRMCRAASRAGARVVASGPDVGKAPAPYLEAGADVALLGEADEALLRAVEALVEGGRPEGRGRIAEIDGVAYLDGSGALRTRGPRSGSRTLRELPPPAWDLIEPERYREAWRRAHGRFSVNMAASRGCPFACVWCAKPPGQLRYDPPEHVWFVDDVFGLAPRWLERFCAGVEARGLKLAYSIQSRVDLLTDEVVDWLARSGCCEVWMGVESGSQQILDRMKKGIRLEDVPRACAKLEARGIRRCIFLQFGFPGETFEDVRKTVELVRALRPDDIGVSVSYPIKGTSFYDAVEAQLSEQRNWQHSSDLAAMFRAEYTSPFYRKLHDVLHREVDLVRRLRRLKEDPGIGEPELLDELGRLSDDWLELGRLEATCRSDLG